MGKPKRHASRKEHSIGSTLELARLSRPLLRLILTRVNAIGLAQQ